MHRVVPLVGCLRQWAVPLERRRALGVYAADITEPYSARLRGLSALREHLRAAMRLQGVRMTTWTTATTPSPDVSRTWPRVYVQARPGAKAVEVARLKEVTVACAARDFYIAKGLRAWVRVGGVK